MNETTLGMRWTRSKWAGIGAALVTGSIYAVSRDLGPIGVLVLIAPLPVLLYALSARSTGSVAISAFLARLIGAAAFVVVYAGTLPAVLIAAFAIGASLEFTAVVLLTRFAAQRLPAWAAVLSFPVLTSALEFLLSLGSAHGSFGALGYAIVDFPILIQLASIGGVAALSFVAALIPMLLAMLIARPVQWRQVACAGGIPLVAVVVFGMVRLSQAPDAHTRIALASIDEHIVRSLQGEAQAELVTQAYVDVVRELARADVDVVVLPERMFAHRSEWQTSSLDALQQAATTLDTLIVAGFDEVLSDGRAANAARVFIPGAQPRQYLKRRMIPGLESQFSPGPDSLIMGKLGVAICKDMDFAPMIRGYGQRGAKLMLVPAWDFGADGKLHSRMAVVRGVENGFAIARAASNGRLTLSDAYGRVIAETITSDQTPATLVANIGLTSTRTIYTRFGDLFGWMIVLAACALGVGLLATIRRSRVADTGHPAIS
jgi:apolipoprotein N-acyltransferase